MKLKELINVCYKNFYCTQEFEKLAYKIDVKLETYAAKNKAWLYNKYIKTKWNLKLEAMFFRPFQVLHLIEK